MSNFDIKDYGKMVTELAKPGHEIAASVDGIKMHRLHMAVGISGEVAELINGYNNDDHDNVREELGDIEFYLEGLRQSIPNDYFGEAFGMCYAIDLSTPDACVIMAGEVLDLVKKEVMYNKELQQLKLAKALVAFDMTLANFYHRVEIDREEVKLENMDKLWGKRYKDGYSDAAAEARADKNG